MDNVSRPHRTPCNSSYALHKRGASNFRPDFSACREVAGQQAYDEQQARAHALAPGAGFIVHRAILPGMFAITAMSVSAQNGLVQGRILEL
jgi:flavin-dependent dehydrogenase